MEKLSESRIKQITPITRIECESSRELVFNLCNPFNLRESAIQTI